MNSQKENVFNNANQANISNQGKSKSQKSSFVGSFVQTKPTQNTKKVQSETKHARKPSDITRTSRPSTEKVKSLIVISYIASSEPNPMKSIRTLKNPPSLKQKRKLHLCSTIQVKIKSRPANNKRDSLSCLKMLLFIPLINILKALSAINP